MVLNLYHYHMEVLHHFIAKQEHQELLRKVKTPCQLSTGRCMHKERTLHIICICCSSACCSRERRPRAEPGSTCPQRCKSLLPFYVTGRPKAFVTQCNNKLLHVCHIYACQSSFSSHHSSPRVYKDLQWEQSLSFVPCNPGVSLVLRTNPLGLEMLQQVFLLEQGGAVGRNSLPQQPQPKVHNNATLVINYRYITTHTQIAQIHLHHTEIHDQLLDLLHCIVHPVCWLVTGYGKELFARLTLCVLLHQHAATQHQHEQRDK